ncbi:pilus assembly protein TadG-related protein [Ovoidimarina sediminis]|uniref:pilus assembly protein TadG-related protein n=1 Tax=Ovoidimarina sediminis TaxID=3079856 RepID=UPI002907DBF8|nr:pilus assembly protein TadG-related protein [Rhodophyticola sp. MJ-SS7]MDU8942116.1 pilus assembly protein TadG-related protein [Rhodophyticola sp. MJ-SS7]
MVSRLCMKFRGEEDGNITILSLFLLTMILMFGGLAIDTWNATRQHTHLQVAADVAAHAALVSRQSTTEPLAKLDAVSLAEGNMPVELFGNVLASANVEFGTWNPATRTFTHTSGATSAARATTQMTRANGNGVKTFLMKILGIWEIDLTTTSVFAMEEGLCNSHAGFFAVGIIDVQSQNNYDDEFCLHSETHVELNNGNSFAPGTIVSMPVYDDLVAPGDKYTNNPGLKQAHKEDSMTKVQKIIDSLPTAILEYEDPYSDIQDPAYLSVMAVNKKTMKKDVTALVIASNAVNIFGCTGQTLTIGKNEIIENAVLITECKLTFRQGAAVENAVVISTAVGMKAVSAPLGLRLGDVDFCTDGLRGATLISMGDIHFAAGFQGYGANIIAAGDIHASSQANGLAGVNFTAGGRIDNPSNNSMANCGRGPDVPEFVPPTFTMVQ